MSEDDRDDNNSEFCIPAGVPAEQVLRRLLQDGIVDPSKLEAAIAAVTDAGQDPFRDSRRVKGDSIRFAVDPRDIPPHKVARLLHISAADFVVRLDEFYARGFPRPDETTGNYDLVAVHAWMDRRSDLTLKSALTPQKQPRNSQDGFRDRARRLANGQG